MRATSKRVLTLAQDGIAGVVTSTQQNNVDSPHSGPPRSSAATKLRKSLRSFSRSTDGSMAVILALSLVGVLGVAALGVEVAAWYQAKRQMQTAADAAAVAVALSKSKGLSDSDMNTAATTVVTGNGLTGYSCTKNGTVGANSCIIYNPPSKGAYSSDTDAFEVVLTKNQGTLFANLFRSSVDIKSSGVAKITSSSSPGTGEGYCFLALDTGNTSKAAHLENLTVLPPQCGIVVNSSSDSGLFIQNNSDIQGPTTTVAASYHKENSATINESKWYKSQPATSDPYSSVVVEATYRNNSCTNGNYTAPKNKTSTANPGFYCNFEVSQQSTLNLNPGVYYIKEKLIIGNNTTITGTGVTFVIVKNGMMELSGNTTLNIDAPTTGPLAGIAFMADRLAPYFEQKPIKNNTHLRVNGAFYFPSQKLTIENAPSIENNTCTQMIAKHLHFQNKIEFQRNCAGTGVKEITGYVSATTTSTVSIVE